MKVGNFVGQTCLVLDRGDAIQLRFEPFCSVGVDGLRIHTGEVIVADLLLIGRARGFFGGIRLQRLQKDRFVPKSQRARDTPNHLIGRYGMGGEPLSVCILVKVVARFGLGIHVGGVEVFQLRELL